MREFNMYAEKMREENFGETRINNQLFHLPKHRLLKHLRTFGLQAAKRRRLNNERTQQSFPLLYYDDSL